MLYLVVCTYQGYAAIQEIYSTSLSQPVEYHTAKYRASLSFEGLMEKYPHPINFYDFVPASNNNIAMHYHDGLIGAGTMKTMLESRRHDILPIFGDKSLLNDVVVVFAALPVGGVTFDTVVFVI